MAVNLNPARKKEIIAAMANVSIPNLLEEITYLKPSSRKKILRQI